MDFFIASAYAQDAAAEGNPWFSLVFMGLIIVLFYFLLIRPQTKRQKEHRQMVDALKEGDEVVTQGGILGRIDKVDEQFVTLNVGGGQKLQIQRHAVGSLVPKGTFEDK
ncbi:preprotein translocase subunit YajC [Natronospira bacteriovora]|uniref:Sec translocon accessory complex subunit YajC n=1 Tax=Natronospira bacteriovora TaxID=3069753 RepID=A0ABU0W5N5_9GAMM|nr:preprotein translocase subunit YajC [Natronospira sp. AB-CW4]MDQ2069335.1 preprotein translocase subunit YajC [Natronospira sp. AB-CW4]